jgi:hypothetical protein
MAYIFKITFPGNQKATLFASTKAESDDMERALIASQADYVIQAPKWIGGSFQMTPAAHEALNRLAPVQSSSAVSLDDVLRKFPLDSLDGIAGVDRDSIAQPNCV